MGGQKFFSTKEEETDRFSGCLDEIGRRIAFGWNIGDHDCVGRGGLPKVVMAGVVV